MDSTERPEGQIGELANDGAADEEDEDSSLKRSGRLFGGLVADIRRKAPWYLSDFRDGMHIQCLASAFFMYFGCLVPMVMFGGLLGSVTDNDMAAFECLVSGAICGVTYHLFSGQPLTIISSTGPVLVFEGIVCEICRNFDWYYLGFRFWIGFWICLIFLVFVAFDLSFLVCYITRFTEESFAALIAIIFIFEAFTKQFQQRNFWQESRALGNSCHCQFGQFIYEDDIGNASALGLASSTAEDCLRWGGKLICDSFPDPFFDWNSNFSHLLFLGTFLLSLLLRQFKRARCLPFLIRSCISDFAVVAAVFIMTFVDAGVGLTTAKLQVPDTFRPTRPDRGWVIDPFWGSRNPWYTVLAALPLGLFAAILMFMDQHIPTVIITRKDKKLKKGSGFHLDLLVVALQVAVCSAFGTPWFVGATILSINHVNSLTVETEASTPGERPIFLGIREQRVTGILVFLLIGISVFIAQVLKFVPMSVLYGVFLYMGVASFQGMQLIERLRIILIPNYCLLKETGVLLLRQKVRMRRIKLFTAIQLLCILALLVVKEIRFISILFPLLVVAICIIRKALDLVFTYDELLHMDDILPGSKRKHTRNGLEPDNTGALELQAEAACMIPETHNDITLSESRGPAEGVEPDALPPAYHTLVHRSDELDDPLPPYDAVVRLPNTAEDSTHSQFV